MQLRPAVIIVSIGASLLAGALPMGAPAATAATIAAQVDLGTLGGTGSAAVAINDAGQIAGYSNPTGSTDQHAFRWDATNGMTDLGTLGGTYSIPVAMNGAGTVVGRSPIATGASHAFVWDSTSGLVDIGTFGGADTATPTAINDAGAVVGASTYSGTATHAFRWDASGGLVDLGTLGGSGSGAMDINDAGQIVGWSSIAGDTATHAFVWDSTSGMVDIGALGGTGAVATVINEIGQVAGKFAPVGGGTHVFWWDLAGGMIDLGTTSGYVSEVTGISSTGEVSGFGFDAFTQAHGFVADPTGGFTEIDADGPLLVASDISGSGQVVGTSWGNDVDHAFVFERGTGARLLPTGPFGAGAVAINDSGQVAGTAFVGGFLTAHAVTWITAAAPTAAIASASVVEGDGGAGRTVQFAVTLSDPATTEVTVPYSITASVNQAAATSGSEFRAKSGTIRFKPTASGFTATTKYVATIVYPDATEESDETFVVKLGAPTGGYSLGTSIVTARILDDDPAPATPAVSAADAGIWEGDSGTKNTAKVWITLNAAATTTVSVTVTVGGGSATATTDYKAYTKLLTFAPGQYKKAIAVIAYPDTVVEGDETVDITLSSPGGGLVLGRANATLSILGEE